MLMAERFVNGIRDFLMTERFVSTRETKLRVQHVKQLSCDFSTSEVMLSHK